MPLGVPSDFDSLATDYAQFRTSYSPSLFAAILEYARLGPRARVLDLACGTGLSMQPYLERGYRVCGVDIAPKMMELARLTFRGKYEAEFVAGRAEALPFSDESFDLISSAQAFHWFDADRAFAECARVLRPGASLAIFWKHAAPDDPYTLTVEAIIREWLGEAAAVRSRDHADEHAGTWEAFWRYVAPAGHVLTPTLSSAAPPFLEGEKRTLSFKLARTVDSFVGYQRSREKIRIVLGERRSEFLVELERRLRKLAPADGHFEQKQIEYIFLARKPALF